MSERKDSKLTIPIAFWETEEIAHIPIIHRTRIQAELARWLKPLGRPGPRKPLIVLNPQEPL